MNFVVPGTITRKPIGKRRFKPMPVDFWLEADDREDALWQAHHGVIEADANKAFPGASIKYNLRKLRKSAGGFK